MLAQIALLIIPILLSGLNFILLLKFFKISLLDLPLDCGLKLGGKRIFGKNKTIKGPLFMSIFSMFYGVLIYQLLKNQLDVQFSNVEIVRNFFIAGLSYSLGELPNSFLKRQLSIAPGKKFDSGIKKYFFEILDILDSLIVLGICYFLLFNFSHTVIFISIFIGAFIHLGTDIFMKNLKLKS